MSATRGSAASAIDRMRGATSRGLSAEERPAAGADAPEPRNAVPEQPSTPESTTQRPAKPVRVTIDFSPAQHTALKVWTVQNGVQLAETVRALTARLLDDPELAAEVLEAARARRQALHRLTEL